MTAHAGASTLPIRVRKTRANSMPNTVRILRFAAISLALGTLAGCGMPDVTPPPAERTEKVYTIAVSRCTLEEPWREQMDAEIRAAAAEHPDLRVILKNAGGSGTKRRPAKECSFSRREAQLLILQDGEFNPLLSTIRRYSSRPIAATRPKCSHAEQQCEAQPARPLPPGGLRFAALTRFGRCTYI